MRRAASRRGGNGQRTHRGTAHEDDDKGPNDTSDSHQPGHPEEEDHAEDVLDARQIDAHQSAELGGLQEDDGIEFTGRSGLLHSQTTTLQT